MAITFSEETDAVPFLTDDDLCVIPGCEQPRKEWAGRGRRPTKCVDHSGGRASTSAAPRVTNDKKAQRAAERLCELNDLIGLGVMAFGLTETASALAQSRESFQVEAYAALKTDDKLCDMILRAGAVTGKVALLSAYAMLTVKLAPVAVMERKMIVLAREAENDGA